MTMPAMPTRDAIERAAPLEFNVEKQANIEIAVGPHGLTITASYTGTLSSIPAAVERLRSAGILALVSAAAAPMTPAHKKEKISPLYSPDGTAVCPVHLRPLQESQHGGHYCSAKARPGDSQNARGYCNLVFED